MKVDVIVTWSTPSVLATKKATSEIPIVFAAASDPIGGGLVANLARPGGNVTGLSIQATEISGKRVELLREALHALSRLAIMGNGDNSAVVAKCVRLRQRQRSLVLTQLCLKSGALRTFGLRLKSSKVTLMRCMFLPSRWQIRKQDSEHNADLQINGIANFVMVSTGIHA
jgi:putative ABC transport system substrate-binding protein